MHVWIFCQLRHQIRRFMSHLAIVDVVCHIIILQPGKVWNFSNTKQLEKSRLIKSDCETVTASRNKEVVCMYARCHTSCGRFTACIATYKLNMLQQKDRKCWPHRKHGPQALPHTWDSSLHCMRSNTHYCYAYTAVKLYCVFGWSSCSISITSQSLWILTVETHLNTVIAEWWLALIMGKETAVSITMDSIGHPFSETSCSKAQIPHSWMHENWTWNQYKRLGKRVSIFDRRYIHDDFFGVPVHVPIPCYESGDHVSQIPTSSPIWAKAERQLELSEMAF